MEEKARNFDSILKLSIIMFLLISVISIGLNIHFNNVAKEIQKENLEKIVALVEKIKISDSKNDFKLVIEAESSDQIRAISDKNYKEFIVQYNENQSNWFNTWLTILSIILGLMGLIIPICFMKLYQDKKDEIDKLIDKVEQQKVEFKTQNDRMGNLIKQSEIHKEKMDKAIENADKQKRI